MRYRTLFTLITLGCATLGFAEEQERSIPTSDDRVYCLSEMTAEGLLDLQENLSSSILVCPAGTFLPISLFLTGDFLEMSSECTSNHPLKIKKTFYLRIRNGDLEISFDGVEWGSWERKLTGALSVQIEMQGETPHLRVGGEFFERE